MIEDGTLEADGKISADEFVKALFVHYVTVFVHGSETAFTSIWMQIPTMSWDISFVSRSTANIILKSADSTDYTSNTKGKFFGKGIARNGIRKETTPMSNSRVSTWSGIRNKLENDYLCPALRGHIQYFATSYSKSADHEGRAAIRVDGVEVLRSNYYTYFENVWTKFHHLRSTTLKDHDSAKEAINQAHAYALEQGTFDQKVFYEAFGIFDNQSIEKSLVSENPLVRIFALLDRRLGKRRLLALEDSMEQELDWVRAFYVIRLQAEGLMEANNI